MEVQHRLYQRGNGEGSSSHFQQKCPDSYVRPATNAEVCLHSKPRKAGVQQRELLDLLRFDFFFQEKAQFGEQNIESTVALQLVYVIVLQKEIKKDHT